MGPAFPHRPAHGKRCGGTALAPGRAQHGGRYRGGHGHAGTCTGKIPSSVLIDAALFETPRSGGFLAIPPLNRWMLAALTFLFTNNRIKSLLASAYGTEPTPEQIEGYLTPLRLPEQPGHWPTSSRRQKTKTQRLRDLKVPIFAVWGSRDTWVPLEELDKLMAIRPDMTVQLIEGAAHCPMETHPEIFADAVLRWLCKIRMPGCFGCYSDFCLELLNK